MLPASIFPTPGAVSGAWICLQLGVGGGAGRRRKAQWRGGCLLPCTAPPAPFDQQRSKVWKELTPGRVGHRTC